MNKDPFEYQAWVDRALRGVIPMALEEVARSGLWGNHHFYIGFRSDHPGVSMPGWLRERYPTEITVVVQHEYWDLEVLADRFRITLSFSDMRCPLEVPFAAVQSFADPEAQFGLQFKAEGVEEIALLDLDEGLDDDLGRDVVDLDLADVDMTSPDKSETSTADDEKEGQVVSLDAFRNKK